MVSNKTYRSVTSIGVRSLAEKSSTLREFLQARFCSNMPGGYAMRIYAVISLGLSVDNQPLQETII